MNIGKRIKQKRIELGMSVDEVANKLGKNRATIYRYESNDIEKLPVSILEPLSIILNTTPAYLMGWEYYDMKYPNVGKECHEYEEKLSRNKKQLLNEFEKLNDLGKKEAIKRVEELTHIDRYSDSTKDYCMVADNHEDYLMPIAAHNDNDDPEQQKLMQQDIDEL